MQNLDKDQLKKELVYYFKKQYDLGMVNTYEGNLSCRLPESDHILITASQQNKDRFNEDMIVEVDPLGNIIGDSPYRPSSELAMHLEVYKIRPDVECVLHNHSTYATAFALVGRPIANDMAEAFMFYGGDIPVAPYGRPGTSDVYKSFNKFFVERDRDALLLANHGLVTVGKSIEEAYAKAEAVEKLARITIVSQILGPDNPLPAVEKQKLIDIYNESRHSKEED